MKTIAWQAEGWKPRFFTIWGGQALSLLGSQIVQFSLVWWLTEQTGSATVLAMASLVAFLPTIVLGPFVGPLVDRWNRRAIMLLADGAIATATLVLALGFALGLASPAVVIGLVFVRAVGAGFHQPAMTASTSLMVPDRQLTRVAGLNQMLQGGLGIISAPLGALFVVLLPIQTVLLIDVGTALFAIAPLLWIAIPQPPVRPGEHGETGNGYWRQLKDGFRYLVNWRGLLILSIFITVVNFVMAPSGALFPILVADHFNGGAPELGWLQAGFSIGIVAGGVILGAWGGFRRRIVTSMVGLFFLGVAYGSLGVIPGDRIWLAILASGAGGLMLPFVNGPVRAILQSTVAPEMQGRVFTLLGSFAQAMIPLGLLIAGPVADAFGVTSWYLIAGLGCAGMAVLSLATPAVIRIEEQRQAPEPESAGQEMESVVEQTR